MEWNLPPHERTYLRELAQKQAAYAALPVMAQRKQMWYDLNDGRPGARPPVIVETWTFDRDFLPANVFRCTSETGRAIEGQLLRHIRNHELIDDDKVMPDTFDIGWFVDCDDLGVEFKVDRVKDSEGIETGYHVENPIKDLERDFHLLQSPRYGIDRVKTRAYQQFLEDLLGEFLKVRIRGGIYGNAMLTQRVVVLMGMEAFFMAMYDTPAAVHRLMAHLRDVSLQTMRWGESEGLMVLNNENQTSFGSSYNFTTKLPAPGYPQNGAPRLRDMWGCSNSQETVGVSPEMFHEFCFPYYRALCEPMGLVYYGCCEPVHPLWDDIRQLPHLKKVSISRWCDQRFMGDALRGTGLVFSRKPDPNFLSVDVTLNEEGWAAHIRETLDATRDVFVEFIVRDVYTVHGNLHNPRRAVEVARREIDRQGR